MSQTLKASPFDPYFMNTAPLCALASFIFGRGSWTIAPGKFPFLFEIKTFKKTRTCSHEIHYRLVHVNQGHPVVFINFESNIATGFEAI